LNVRPVRAAGGALQVADGGATLAAPRELPEGELVLGVRPEYVRIAEPGAPGSLQATVAQVQDIGTSLMLTARLAGRTLKARLAPEADAPRAGEAVWLQLVGEHTCFYRNEELVE
jgi:glycerol transport system ATP-binding protein